MIKGAELLPPHAHPASQPVPGPAGRVPAIGNRFYAHPDHGSQIVLQTLKDMPGSLFRNIFPVVDQS
jgi:hypothetical protein